ALQSRFEAQLAETQKELSKLDNRISDLNKITASLIAYQNQTPQADRAEEVLAAFQIDKLTSPAPLKKELQELQVERGALHEHLDMIIKNFTDYKEIQEKVAKREQEEKRKL
ncbi:helical hairpin domain-containing protein, partial [Streptococcus sp. VTCC 12886]|uniref:helical hairpin domain-containing protein n=1 Tax=Streptococcus sp. VTCC 12886 TaxID=3413767 RepID=UPI003D9C6EBA